MVTVMEVNVVLAKHFKDSSFRKSNIYSHFGIDFLVTLLYFDENKNK